MLLVVGVGDGWAVAEHAGLERHGDKHGVAAKVDALGDDTADDRIDKLRQVQQAILRAQLLLAAGELVDVAAALEAEVLEGLHGGLLAEGTQIELQRAQHHVMREVGFVDTDHQLQRVAADLLGYIDDTGVVLVALPGDKDIEAVADGEEGFVVDHGFLF